MPQQGSRGTAAVEFAIVLPLLVLLVLALVDYGTGLWEAMMVGNAARSGAYYAALNGWPSSGTPTAIEAAVTGATELSSTSTCPLSSTTYNTVSACPVPSQVCYCHDPTANPSPPSPLGTLQSGKTTCSQVTCTSPQVPACYIQVNAQANYSPLAAFTGLTGFGFSYSINAPITLQATSYARQC